LQRSGAAKRSAPFSNLPRSKIARIRELSVGFIVDSDFPFTALESEYIQETFRELNPDTTDQVPWSRSTIKRDLERLWLEKKTLVKEDLSKSLTQIHISFDLWTSPNSLSFIAIFAHFIDRKKNYQSRMLAFRRQYGEHSGDNIAGTIYSVIQDWEIASNIGVSVCDNATNNDTCLRNLYASIHPSMTRADIEQRRMRCFGHILNLVAKSFLFGESADSFELQSDAYKLLSQHEKDLAHWRSKGPIGKLHNVVKFIRASPQRREAFKKHAREHEAADIYKLSEESTAELELQQDNATRWNSTYLMIERAWKKQSELNSYLMSLALEQDSSKRVPVADRLTPDDWKVLGEIQHLLEPIYKLTMRTQGWGTGSSHGRLWEVVAGMEFVLEHLEDWKAVYNEVPLLPDDLTAETSSSPELSSRPANGDRLSRQRKPSSKAQDNQAASTSQSRSEGTHRSSRPFNESALPEHTREEYTRVRSVSLIDTMEATERESIRVSINNAWEKLDEYYTLLGRSPLFTASIILNPNLGLRWLEATWNSSDQLQWLREAKRGIKAYFERWYLSNDVCFEEDEPGRPDESSLPPQSEQSRFDQWVKSRNLQYHSETESELDRYYGLKPEQFADPVQWWIDHKSQFPRLSKFALDILAIPAMSTDCERAFSFAKLTLSDQRLSMLASLVEELQLMKDWMRHGAISLGGYFRAGGRTPKNGLLEHKRVR
jgi:hAT family C-terminal dimerisation region